MPPPYAPQSSPSLWKKPPEGPRCSPGHATPRDAFLCSWRAPCPCRRRKTPPCRSLPCRNRPGRWTMPCCWREGLRSIRAAYPALHGWPAAGKTRAGSPQAASLWCRTTTTSGVRSLTAPPGLWRSAVFRDRAWLRWRGSSASPPSLASNGPRKWWKAASASPCAQTCAPCTKTGRIPCCPRYLRARTTCPAAPCTRFCKPPPGAFCP